MIQLLNTAVLFVLFSASAHAAVLATVNGTEITDKDLKAAISSMPESQQKKILGDAATKNQAVQNLVNQELLVQQARNEKVTESQAFKDAMEAYRSQLLANMVVEKKLGDKVNESAAKEFYRVNKRKFSTAQVHVHHILVNTEDEANKIKAEVQKPGADFQAMAEKHSKDPSAKNNRGDVGLISWGQMVPEFEEAAFGAPKNAIVGPIKTMYGYHIIKVLDKTPGQPLDFHEVEPQVRNALRSKLVQDYVTQLRSKSKIEVK